MRLNVETIAPQLALTDDQKTKVKPVLEERNQKLQELGKDTTLDPAGKRAKFMEIRKDINAKMKDILTPEQFAKWQRIQMLGANRRAPGGAGAPPPAGDTKPPQ
jgi:Spy/CpxP family protein refolding chaperone